MHPQSTPPQRKGDLTGAFSTIPSALKGYGKGRGGAKATSEEVKAKKEKGKEDVLQS